MVQLLAHLRAAALLVLSQHHRSRLGVLALLLGLLVPADGRSGIALAAPAPTVVSVSPNQAYNYQATTITITGNGFVASPTVRLDPGVAARVRAAAEADNLTLSEFIRLAVAREIERRNTRRTVLPGEIQQRLAEVQRAAAALAECAKLLQSTAQDASAEQHAGG